MTDDYKLQTSVKVGANRDDMINVRANSVEELNTLLDGLHGSYGFISSVMTDLANGTAPPPDPTQQAVGTLQQNGFPETQQVQPGVVTPQAQPQTYGQRPPPPQCIHGQMKYYEGTNKNGGAFRAYFCPGPKGPNQCKPQFLD